MLPLWYHLRSPICSPCVCGRSRAMWGGSASSKSRLMRARSLAGWSCPHGSAVSQCSEGPASSPSSVKKEPKFRPGQDGFFEILVYHFLSLLTFQLKSLFLAPTTCLLIYWPVLQLTEVAWAQQQSQLIGWDVESHPTPQGLSQDL